jgi:hypothetical protein
LGPDTIEGKGVKSDQVIEIVFMEIGIIHTDGLTGNPNHRNSDRKAKNEYYYEDQA